MFLRKGALSIGQPWSRDQKFLQNYGATENEYVQTYSEKSTELRNYGTTELRRGRVNGFFH